MLGGPPITACVTLRWHANEMPPPSPDRWGTLICRVVSSPTHTRTTPVYMYPLAHSTHCIPLGGFPSSFLPPQVCIIRSRVKKSAVTKSDSESWRLNVYAYEKVTLHTHYHSCISVSTSSSLNILCVCVAFRSLPLSGYGIIYLPFSAS